MTNTKSHNITKSHYTHLRSDTRTPTRSLTHTLRQTRTQTLTCTRPQTLSYLNLSVLHESRLTECSALPSSCTTAKLGTGTVRPRLVPKSRIKPKCLTLPGLFVNLGRSGSQHITARLVKLHHTGNAPFVPHHPTVVDDNRFLLSARGSAIG